MVRSECQEFGEAGREKASLGDLGEALYTYVLLSVNQELNTFFRKEYPGREAHWQKAWGYLETSLAWRTPGVSATLRVPEQVEAGGEGRLCSCFLNSEIPGM